VNKLLARLKPIIIDIESNLERDGFSRPVSMSEIVGLFSRHSLGEIEIFHVNFALPKLCGMHMNFSNPRKTAIFARPCNYGHEFDQRCDKCRQYRYTVVKELVHIFDSDSDKTSPSAVRAELLEGLVTLDLNRTGASAEYFAIFGAIELLVPYPQRKITNDSLIVNTARATDDYDKLASQFGIPTAYMKLAYSDAYLELIKELRRLNNLTF
jgi:hypothetical protein